MRFEDPTHDDGCSAARYLARVPEGLVVGGYRGWLHFAAMRDVSRLEAVWNEFNTRLDPNAAGLAMAGLERLIRQLGSCAACPLRFHCQGVKHLCRDECLMLSLISGLQNGEDEAAFLSALGLTSADRASTIVTAGGEFAMALKISGHQLLPIHADTVRWLATGRSQPAKTTLH